MLKWRLGNRFTVFKLFHQIIMLEKKRKEQAGFRKGRSTTEQIFVLRNIIEQAVEWNSSLYPCLKTMRRLSTAYTRNPLEDRDTSKDCEDDASDVHQLLMCGGDGESRTDWFEVRSGVKQGCNMSGFLFLVIID